MDVNEQRKKSGIAIAIVAAIWLFVIFNLGYFKKQNVIVSDTISYYSYLPAYFIQHDVGLSFLSDSNFKLPVNAYWHHLSPIHKPVFKMTMGWAIMYLPAFIIADTYMKITATERTGFEVPYHLAIALFTWLYAVLAFYVLRNVLLHFFNDAVVTFTISIMALATNFTCYVTIESGSVHVINFMLASCLIYSVIAWHIKPLHKYAVYIGLLLAMLILIRPSNIVWILLPLLYNVTSTKNFKSKVATFFTSNKSFFFMLVGVLIFIPQFIYWHHQTGQWIYYSYADENFFWLNPKIFDVMFGFRKGWLVYTPVMLFALAGFITMRTHLKNLFFPAIIIFILAIYITSCWWCWWYGGSYGMRPLIDYYPLLALPMACMISILWHRKNKMSIAVVIVLTIWNLYTTYQYKRNVLHYDSMTAKAYSQLFFNFSAPDGYDKMLKAPDYIAAKNNNNR